MSSMIFCNHYRAMYDNATCSAGVSYDEFKGMHFDKRPCFCKPGSAPNPGCSLMEMPTPEQLAAEDEERRKRWEMIKTARAAIVNHLGPWNRGYGATGQIDCPVCGKEKNLGFYRAGYNGHIHAICSTEGCVSWME